MGLNKQAGRFGDSRWPGLSPGETDLWDPLALLRAGDVSVPGYSWLMSWRIQLRLPGCENRFRDCGVKFVAGRTQNGFPLSGVAQRLATLQQREGP